MRRLTKDEIINRFVKKYGDLYDYSLVNYSGMDTKIKIICKKHGVFEQTPHNHLKYGCKFCGVEKQVSQRTGNTKLFISKSQLIHGDKYNYSFVNYTTAKEKVEIVCPIHGHFWQTPDSHLSGYGCPKCGLLSGVKKSKLTKKENHINPQFTLTKFKELCTKQFDGKYDYSLITDGGWKGLDTRIKIICPEHGIFEQKAKNHRWGLGCRKCNQSKGERKIKQFLDSTGVNYTTEYTFEDCVDKTKLPFDFALFNGDGSIRCLIEYQGQQHFKVVDFWGKTEFDLKDQQRRDQIKRDYCHNNGICLLEVSYKQDLNEFFEEAGGLLWK